MHIVDYVRKIAGEAGLTATEVDMVLNVLLPIVREKFKGMQFPSIEIWKEDDEVKLKAFYIFQ